MIYRKLYIPEYDWLTHIFYHVTCYWVDDIIDMLESIDCPEKELRESYENLMACKLNTGLTYSNYRLRESVMVISDTSSAKEFSNSLRHECRHLEDHISIAYGLSVGGEEVCYLAGFIGEELSDDMAMFICDCDCHEKDIKKQIYQQENNEKNDYKD